PDHLRRYTTGVSLEDDHPCPGGVVPVLLAALEDAVRRFRHSAELVFAVVDVLGELEAAAERALTRAITTWQLVAGRVVRVARVGGAVDDVRQRRHFLGIGVGPGRVLVIDVADAYFAARMERAAFVGAREPASGTVRVRGGEVAGRGAL